MINKDVMENLKKSIGREIVVDDIWGGDTFVERSKLKAVDDFVDIDTEYRRFVFIGPGDAIKTIVDAENRKILYENPLIIDDYDLRSDKEINRMRERAFGKKVAAELRRKRK